VSCTQEELLQVMQKLISERQKVKSLERKLKSSPCLAEAPFNSETEKEVEVLKNIIRELSEKLKAAQQEQKGVVTPSSSHTQEDVVLLRQTLSMAQKESRLAKEKAIELEEEVRRLQQFRATLQAELKESGGKAHSYEKAIKEIEHYKGKIAELEQARLDDLQKNSKDIPEIESLRKELEKRKAALAEEQKEKEKIFALRLASLEEEKRALSDKVAILQLSTRDRANEQESLYSENKNRILQIKSLEEELQIEKRKNVQFDLERQKIKTELEIAIAKVETMQKLLRESQEETKKITEDGKKIIEAQQEAEVQIKKQKEKIEQQKELLEKKEQEIEELETHLARRVKDCALLKDDLEEAAAEKQKQKELIDTLQKDNETRKNSSRELEGQIAKRKEEMAALEEYIEEQNLALEDFADIKEKYIALVELFEKGFEEMSTRKKISRPKLTLTQRKMSTLPHQEKERLYPQHPSIKYDLFQ
jgi:chromosome segregation ATPase